MRRRKRSSSESLKKIHYDDSSVVSSNKIPAHFHEIHKCQGDSGTNLCDSSSTSSTSTTPSVRLQYELDLDGVPFHPQNIIIDFTPIPGVDDEYVLQQKCIDFWEFIGRQKNIHRLLVTPEQECQSLMVSGQGVFKDNETLELDVSSSPTASTAVDYMNMDEKLGVAFVVDNRCKDNCLLENSSYHDIRHNKNPKSKSTDMKQMNKMMDDFDMKKSKSSDAPSRTPTLVSATLQRLPPVRGELVTACKGPTTCLKNRTPCSYPLVPLK